MTKEKKKEGVVNDIIRAYHLYLQNRYGHVLIEGASIPVWYVLHECAKKHYDNSYGQFVAFLATSAANATAAAAAEAALEDMSNRLQKLLGDNDE